MAGASVKLGVEYSQFKQGMNEAKESVKTLTEKLKENESQLKLTGDQEVYLRNKVLLLNQKISAQKTIVANAMKALQEMKNKGVSPTDQSYQRLEQTVYRATDQLNKMRVELRDVETNADGAGKEAGEMNEELQKIGKDVAWGNVAEGLDNITRKLESGARAAVNFGKKVLASAKDSTQWADELKTTVEQYSDMGLTSDSLQRMQKVEDFIDTPVEAILNAKARMQKATATTGGVKAFEEILGINLNGQNTEDLFWETGEAILGMGEAFDKEKAAQDIFGRSWRELLPLFKTGREEYEKMLSEQNVLTEDQVQSLAEADDAIKKAEQQIADLKNQFWAENADKITGLMGWFVEHREDVVTALTAIGGAFGLLKLGSVAANLMKIVSGFQTLGMVKGGEAVTGGDAAVVTTGGNGGTGGGFFGRMLNSLSLFAGASAVSDATHGQAIKTFKEFLEEAKGKTGEESSIIALMHDLGVTEEQARSMVSSPKKMTPQEEYVYWAEQNELAQATAQMTQTMEDSFAGQQQSNSEVTAALGNLEGLPAAMSAAVQAGMANVTIVISEGAMNSIGRRTGRMLGDQVKSLLN